MCEHSSERQCLATDEAVTMRNTKPTGILDEINQSNSLKRKMDGCSIKAAETDATIFARLSASARNTMFTLKLVIFEVEKTIKVTSI